MSLDDASHPSVRHWSPVDPPREDGGQADEDRRRHGREGRRHLESQKYRPIVAALVKQARTRAIEQHYREGVRLYREEKPAEAVVEWRAVLALDPEHANAKKNIDQAERLLKALEEKKKK